MNQLSVRRSDPFGSLVDDVFNDFFQRTGVLPTRGGDGATVARARMDVVDKGDKFEIKVDLPGVSKEDINVSVEGPRVTRCGAASKPERTASACRTASALLSCAQLRRRSVTDEGAGQLRERRADADAAEAR
jgi:hypothetical protein